MREQTDNECTVASFSLPKNSQPSFAIVIVIVISERIKRIRYVQSSHGSMICTVMAIVDMEIKTF